MFVSAKLDVVARAGAPSVAAKRKETVSIVVRSMWADLRTRSSFKSACAVSVHPRLRPRQAEFADLVVDMSGP